MSRRSKRKRSGLSIKQHRKLIKGDEKSWSKIIKRYTPYLLSCSQRMDGHYSWSCIEDATQETFLRAVEQIKELKKPGAFNKWLSKIFVGVISHDNTKEYRQSGLRLIKEKPYHICKLRKTCVSNLLEEEPIKRLYNEELLKRIKKHLLTLSPQERDCVNLRFRNEMSLDEIAEELHTSNAVIRTQISNGIRKLENEFFKDVVGHLDQLLY